MGETEGVKVPRSLSVLIKTMKESTAFKISMGLNGPQISVDLWEGQVSRWTSGPTYYRHAGR